MVNGGIDQLSRQFKFFYEKFSQHNNTKRKKKTNKTKINKQNTAKATMFGAQNLLIGVKLFILRFLFKISFKKN